MEGVDFRRMPQALGAVEEGPLALKLSLKLKSLDLVGDDLDGDI
jgi:hypothetical protein